MSGSNPWGLKDLKPGSLKTISNDKLATFAVGQQKKSRFQKAREEAEEKKRQEDLETSKLYDTFVASFETDDRSKTFVRGGSSGTDDKGSMYRTGLPGEIYKLEASRGHTESIGSSSPAPSGKPMKEMDKMLLDFKVEFDAEIFR